jgi:long-chain acyl-CoA synthetase
MSRVDASPSAHLRAVRYAPPPGFLERFDAHASASPEAVAIEIEGEGRRVTYAELRAMIEQYRGALCARGVCEGEAVIVALPSSAELVASFFALASLGAIAVPVSPSLRETELAPVLADARPSGAIVADDTHPLARETSLRFAVEPRKLSARALSLDAPRPGNVVSCHFTYKGLGYPLGALHRYSDFTACVDALVDRHALTGDAAHLVVLPIHPVYALVAGVLTPLSLGARVVIVPHLEGKSVLDLLVKHSARVACLVPLLFAQLAAKASARKDAASSLAPGLELVSGGSYLEPSLAAAVKNATGIEPHQGYGLTETLPVTTNTASHARPGTLGAPISNDVRVAVVDAAGHDLPAGRVGEITIAGPTVTCGYVNRPRESARFLRNDRFHTGDLGAIDDGFLRFEGRALPFTKCASQMVDLVEIENVLRRHPRVADARVSVQIDRRIGERLRAAVVVKRGASVEPREISAFVRAHLSPHKVPRDVTLYGRAYARTGT